MKGMLGTAAIVTVVLLANAAVAADAGAVRSPRAHGRVAQHSRAIAHVRPYPTYYARPVYYRPYPYFGVVLFGLSVGPDWAW
jgi:hypothetical protein